MSGAAATKVALFIATFYLTFESLMAETATNRPATAPRV